MKEKNAKIEKPLKTVSRIKEIVLSLQQLGIDAQVCKKYPYKGVVN